MYYCHMESPVGKLLRAGDEEGLRLVRFPDEQRRCEAEPAWIKSSAFLKNAVRQLEAYFAGKLKVFSLETAPKGTPFQLQVLRALQEIPYGETISYGELAGKTGRPKASRAVGGACARNPIPIVIPCHRVIGSDGSLTGFGGGIRIKAALLALEQGHR